MLRTIAPLLLVLSAMPAPAAAASALCPGKGTVDQLEPIPASLAPVAARLFGISDTAFAAANTVYRCVRGEIWLCNYGANLVCGKANRSRANPGAQNWCKENPDAADIPMAATGHDTIYSWRCSAGEARITGEIAKVDARGFIAENWKRVP